MTTLTIELRNNDGSILTTIKCSERGGTWHDINTTGSPLNVTKGLLTEGNGQIHCKDGSLEVLRLVNIGWASVEGSHSAAFCYGCKLGFEREPRWYLTKRESE